MAATRPKTITIPTSGPAAAVTPAVAADAEFTPVDAVPQQVITVPGMGVDLTDIPGDATPLDPRDVALAALVAPRPATDANGAIPLPLERLDPELTGDSLDWDPAGEWFLVWASLYPRMIGEDRVMARRGDLVRVPLDHRTEQDLALGYLVSSPPPLLPLVG